MKASSRPTAATPLGWPATASLLAQGGDDRIVTQASTGRNRYGCRATPEHEVLALGSSTASSISRRGHAAADQLRRKWVEAGSLQAACEVHAREMAAMRQELAQRLGADGLPGTEVVLTASGTDLHLIAVQMLTLVWQRSPLVIMMDGQETGSGVVQALQGRHFNARTALGHTVEADRPVDPCMTPPTVVSLPIRTPNGRPRASEDLRAEIEALIRQAVAQDRPVLLVPLDVSKTGLRAPAPHDVLALQGQWPQHLAVMVDASQLRMTPATLRHYLDHGCTVAVTGSKFLTGPSFCGAWLVPPAWAERLKDMLPPHDALAAYTSRAEWPAHWRIQQALNNDPNFGLALRWRAAMAELRAFQKVPPGHVRQLTRVVAQAITRRIDASPWLERLPGASMPATPALLGRPEADADWDTWPTIFPFVLNGLDGEGCLVPMGQAQTQRIYQLMRDDLWQLVAGDRELSRPCLRQRVHLGQPVACGEREGVPVSALRLCLSSRLIVEATQGDGSRVHQLMAGLMSAIDKLEWLAQFTSAHTLEIIHAG